MKWGCWQHNDSWRVVIIIVPQHDCPYGFAFHQPDTLGSCLDRPDSLRSCLHWPDSLRSCLYWPNQNDALKSILLCPLSGLWTLCLSFRWLNAGNGLNSCGHIDIGLLKLCFPMEKMTYYILIFHMSIWRWISSFVRILKNRQK